MSTLDRRRPSPNAFHWAVGRLEIVHHQIERRVGAGGRRTGPEHEVGTSPHLEHNEVGNPLDLSHPNLAPEVNRSIRTTDPEHHVPDPDPPRCAA